MVIRNQKKIWSSVMVIRNQNHLNKNTNSYAITFKI